MGFFIINSIPIATINNLNSRFNLNLARVKTAGGLSVDDYEDNKFYEIKRFMEANKPVEYECNKY